jgi:hypothetical protein
MSQIFRVEYRVVVPASAIPCPPTIRDQNGNLLPPTAGTLVDGFDDHLGSRKVGQRSRIGMSYAYVRSPVMVVLQANSQHPADLFVPLNNNVSLLPNEVIEIISVRNITPNEIAGATVLM